MTIRSPDGALSSDSFFDSPPETAYYISNITEWRKEIPTPVISAPDFPFSSDFQDMSTSEFFELKDTVSECSMDSAYQSQSGASRRGARKPEMHRQESQMSSHFVGSDIYSPTMSSDNFSAFPDTLDMSHVQPPATSGSWEPTDGSLSYANFSTAQDYSHYSTSNLPQWPSADAQFQNNTFPFSSWPSHSANDAMFSTPTSQRNWQSTSIDASERPTAARYSSYSFQEESRRASTHDSTFGAFVGTPTSTTSAHFPTVDIDQSRLAESRENGDRKVVASAPQSLDEHDETMSQSEAAETKLEEERTKVARSHPLYQQTPDKDGKYHCPEEGKAGCSHKPTALKCNYDKYVDSHLKPFRCNKKTCVGVQFSSTACLLRHEREAHGMHGHGARPHLCHFRDCERAVPGHGFPRRYNLFDHMKRVHQYDGPTTEPSPLVQGQPARKSSSRKRKASSEESGEKRAKVVKLTAEQQRQQRREVLAKEFLAKKQHIIDVLTNLSNPSDLGDDIQLTKEVVGLHDICTQYRDVFGG